jgi:hypothetical protein
VLWQDRSDIAAIRAARDRRDTPGTPLFEPSQKAIAALENGNPFLYTPHYSARHAAECWGIQDAEAKANAAREIAGRS